jgi:chromosome segregation ATPase
LEQNAVEKQASPPNELKTLEGGLKALWDRVKLAGETIARLREERTALQAQVRELEAKVAECERMLGQHRATIKGLETQLAERPAATEGILFNGDREALTAQVKDLLARLEAYL